MNENSSTIQQYIVSIIQLVARSTWWERHQDNVTYSVDRLMFQTQSTADLFPPTRFTRVCNQMVVSNSMRNIIVFTVTERRWPRLSVYFSRYRSVNQWQLLWMVGIKWQQLKYLVHARKHTNQKFWGSEVRWTWLRYVGHTLTASVMCANSFLVLIETFYCNEERVSKQFVGCDLDRALPYFTRIKGSELRQ